MFFSNVFNRPAEGNVVLLLTVAFQVSIRPANEDMFKIFDQITFVVMSDYGFLDIDLCWIVNNMLSVGRQTIHTF